MSPRRKPKQGAFGCFTRLILVFAVLAVVTGVGLYLTLGQPYGGFSSEQFVELKRGMGTSEIADELEAHHVIRSHWLFLLARAVRPSARLQAGEYHFTEPASVWGVFDRIVRGDVFRYELTIPEGSNIFDIARILDRMGYIKGDDFLTLAENPALIHDLAPNASSLEGYLFPSTYSLTRNATAVQLVHLMVEQFRKRWHTLRPNGRGKDVNRTVTLASLVEKETGIASDRPIVASVYVNRLNKGMKLDCDPTTIYAALLDGRYRGKIHKSDLANMNPYNTYKHAGLPPGPIANPGMASLKAALEPAETDFLYFVAKPDGSGGHNFAHSLTEHQRFVKEYRAGQR